ncbi:RNA polymerase Rpb1 domain 2 family protein (apicoplast) [Babesia bovis T2Bo]|uniref:DNA-directed RNA polymerase n=1 Tax=Babesia bovis TaxID=5865 RepID=A7AXE4_BABBO|nr:RNA polymerase Rpb1 domain 2 family protein [Babesia bovis T2Bo]EDO05067.1 RNA polymerase Rpb1 domain 2 family protein [Babesia bovis T2Bo]|eukprot:YP_002290847.1 rpoC1 (apicoplast) [Babesia bovis T2Bo]
MKQYKNIEVSFLNYNDILNKIVRVDNEEFIISLVYNSSPYLHKRIRYRDGGILCEKIFGYRYICHSKTCNKVLKFNENRIKNSSCYYCGKAMKFNNEREGRYGAIFLYFPICNPINIKNLSDLFKLFKKFNEFDKYNVYYGECYRAPTAPCEEQLSASDFERFFNRFYNFINFLYEFCKILKLFKTKLFRKKSYKSKIFSDNIHIIKHIQNNHFTEYFVILMPVIPINLRENLGKINNKKIDSKFNYIYRFLLNANNTVLNRPKHKYNLKSIAMLFFTAKTLITYTLFLDAYPDSNNIYNRLHGKYGLFRQKLLGFRVDCSGRSVIVPGPDLHISYVGLPSNMLHKFSLTYKDYEDENKKKLRKKIKKFRRSILKLYDPNLKTISRKKARKLSNRCLLSCDLFDNTIDNTVIVNRAPTLHKMNTQSFHPLMAEGRAVKFTPICCAGYNADFDGDQMGVFSIIFKNSLIEAQLLTRPMINLYSPTNKKNIFNLTQGALLGKYTLTAYNYTNCLSTSVIACNNAVLVELSFNNFYVNSPYTLRHYKRFYKTTIGRQLTSFKVDFKRKQS